MKQPGPPRRHHFLPEFYLRPWAGSDGRLERFTKTPLGEVHVKRVAPARIGWERDLYAEPGADPGDPKAQWMETGLFGPLDSAAALCRDELLDGRWTTWPGNRRTPWAMFLLSLFHRSPEHMAATMEALTDIRLKAMPNIQRQYETVRTPADPPRYEDWERQHVPLSAERTAHRILPSTIDNEVVGSYIINMIWGVVTLASSDWSLLTSDNPVIIAPLKLDHGHLAIPISPTKLFVAANKRSLLERMMRDSPNQIVRTCTRLIVENADRVVAATDREQSAFVSRRMGTKRLGSVATGFRVPEPRDD